MVQSHLRQVFSSGMAKFWASTGATWQDMLVAEALDYTTKHYYYHIFVKCTVCNIHKYTYLYYCYLCT